MSISSPARMQWQQLLSAQRFKVKSGVIVPSDAVAKSDIDAGLRTAFHIDHDRLVFSTAFRRLARFRRPLPGSGLQSLQPAS